MGIEQQQGPVQQQPVRGDAAQQPAQQGAVRQPNQDVAENIENELVDKGQVKLGPAQEAQLDAYTDNATIAVYSEKTQPTILQLLQSEETAEASIATAAFYVHKQLEGGLQKSGERPTEITLCLGAAHLVSELVALSEAAGLYETTNEQRLEAFRLAVKKYFEEGLEIYSKKGPDAPGAIDPVKLQQTVEPLLTPAQKKLGTQWAQQAGISQTAPASGMMALETKMAGGQQQQQPAPQGLLAGGQQ